MTPASPLASPTADVPCSEATPPAVETAQERREPESTTPETLSAEKLHEHLQRCHRLGARARLRLIAALRALHKSGLYAFLGCSSILQYAAKHFGNSEALTYEMLRVAEVIDTLPKCRLS